MSSSDGSLCIYIYSLTCDLLNSVVTATPLCRLHIIVSHRSYLCTVSSPKNVFFILQDLTFSSHCLLLIFVDHNPLIISYSLNQSVHRHFTYSFFLFFYFYIFLAVSARWFDHLPHPRRGQAVAGGMPENDWFFSKWHKERR